MKKYILCLLISFCGCSHNQDLFSGKRDSRQLIQSCFESPSKIHEALGPPNQQYLSGGKLHEIYNYHSEQIHIEYSGNNN